METRKSIMERLAAGVHPDVVIIGAGCNGAGLYRDLALQNIPTLMIDKGDFSSGTSSAPTRLAHGGLRYLETGEISLVRESAEERNLLLLNAPHQVRPLPIWVPLRSWLGGAAIAPARFLGLARSLGPKGAVAVKAGLAVYERFGNRHRTMPRHSMISRHRALEAVPQLSPKICAVAQYYDALIRQPERLVLELVEDGERHCPASMAVPYCEAVGMVDGSLVFRDVISGSSCLVRPRLVINVAGAWVDVVQRRLGIVCSMIGGTKGSHLVVRNKELAVALNGRMLFFEADDYRACIVLSLGGDRLFLGATDLRSDDPEDMECSEDEIDYLFSTMKSILPEVEFTRDDIVYTVAGVRPLPRSDAAETGMISRDHKLHEFAAAEGRPFAVLTLVGGKWTTFRSCAAQIADAVLSHLGLDRIVCTKEVQIGGGRGFPLDNAAQAAWAGKLAERTGIDQQRAELLTCRYGSRAFPIAEAEAAATTQPSLYGYSHAEIGWIAAHERVTRLEDVVQRRTLMAFEGKVSRASLRTVAEIAAPILGWSEEQTAAEIEGAEAALTNRHRMRLDDG